MIKKTRTIIFIICLFLFILITPSIILYSQGYRFDFENKKITQTGGLFIKTSPKQTSIYLNDKEYKKTDFFFSSLFIENLLPKKYKIEVKKEGYHSWIKNIGIKEKSVQEFKNIILFPEEVNFTSLDEKIENFWLSPDQKKLIAQEKEESSWSLKLYDLEKNLKSHLLEEKDFLIENVQLTNLIFSQNSKELTLEVLNEKEQSFNFNLDKKTLNLIIPHLPVEKNLVCQEDNGHTYCLNKFGQLLKDNQELTLELLKVKEENQYSFEFFKNNIFLKENDDLYKLNEETKSFEHFLSNIKILKTSPNNETLACLSDHEIWLIPSTSEAEGKNFLIRFSEKLSDFFWLNNYYLVFIAGDKIKISEIDQRDQLNVIDLFEIKNSSAEESLTKLYWNQSNKKLYLLNEETLSQSNLLFP